jgi:hypothetical protein
MGEAAIAFSFEDYEKTMAANAAEILSKANAAATKAGVTCTTVHIRERHPAEGILETVQARSCDLIVMASHGRRGLSRLPLGSQAHNVVTHSAIRPDLPLMGARRSCRSFSDIRPVDSYRNECAVFHFGVRDWPVHGSRHPTAESQPLGARVIHSTWHNA